MTGAAGYIGSRLAQQLLERGDEVIAVDNFMHHQTSLLHLARYEKLNIIRGDARDKNLLKSLLPGCDFIIPLACLTGAPICQRLPIESQSTNVDAVQSLLKLRQPNQAILYPTTNSGYGTSGSSEMCTEDSPIQPVSLYGKQKVQAESMILEAGNSATFRLATVFGSSPRLRLDLLVNDFTYRAWKDRSLTLFESHFRRNFVYIGDVCDLFCYGIDQFESLNGQTFNFGNDSANMNKMELCQKIQSQLPQFVFHESQIGQDPDKRDYVVSSEKLAKHGFVAKTGIDEGVTELIKAFTSLPLEPFRNA